MRKLEVGLISYGYLATKWHNPDIMILRSVDYSVTCDINPIFSTWVGKRFNLHARLHL